MAPTESPTLRRMVSEVGKAAKFGTPEEEVARILANKSNYYIVLKVLKDSDAAVVRVNYLKLSRMVHPDKCSHPQAPDASAVLNQAKDTLGNPLKKRLYDAYVSDVTEAASAAGAAGAPDMSYAEWEAAQATQQVKIPRWVERVLGVPVVGQVFALLALLILLPLILVVIVIMLCLWLICLPIQILLRCICGAPEPHVEGEPAAGGAPYAAPQQAPPPTAADRV